MKKIFFGCLGRVTVPLVGGSTLHPKGRRSEMSYSETRLPLRERFCHAQFGRSLSLPRVNNLVLVNYNNTLDREDVAPNQEMDSNVEWEPTSLVTPLQGQHFCRRTSAL